MDLEEICEEFGWPSPREMVGRVFRFVDVRDTMFGTIVGVCTSDDGLPVVEVSNRKFSGLGIVHILLKRGGEAILITTAPIEQLKYHWINGYLRFE